MLSSILLYLLFLGSGVSGNIAYVDFPETYENPASSCNLVDTLLVTVRFENDTVHLKLRRNADVDENVPVYVPRQNPKGTEYIVQATVLDIQGSAEYKDVDNKASVEVSCRMVEKDFPHYQLNGAMIFLSDGEMYTLELTRRTKRSIRPHLPGDVYDIELAEPDPADFGQDYTLRVSDEDITQLDLNSTNEIPPIRNRRQTSEVNIDIVPLIDNSVYQRWYQRSTLTDDTSRKAETMQNLRRHFSHIINGIHMRFATISGLYKFNIRLVAYIIEDEKPGNWFTNVQSKENPYKGEIINAGELLPSVRDWKNSAGGLPQYDHIMTWTAYDMYKIKDGEEYDILGTAYLSTLCYKKSSSTSLVEYRGRLVDDVLVAAHEVGHSVGAYHDGDGNQCTDGSSYIMNNGYSSLHSLDHNNQYLFSSCSVIYFEDHIKLALSKGDANCVTDALNQEYVFNLNGELPGRIYDTDTQCIMAYGKYSYFCKDGTDLQTICKRMYCWDDSTSQCLPVNAAEGTSCGTDKACIAGECVDYVDPCEDDAAFETFLGGSCSDSVVSTNRSLCYESIFLTGCCGSCRVRRTGIEDCEYGDKEPELCKDKEGPSCCGLKTECCGTCEVSGSLCSSGKRVNPLDNALILSVLSFMCLFKT